MKTVNNVLFTLSEINSETYDCDYFDPTLPKIGQSDNNEHRLSGTQSVTDLINEEEKTPFDLVQDEKKFISRSTPAIYVDSLSRSDTFIRDENKNNETDDQESVTNSEAHISISSFLQSLNSTREAVMNLAEKLDDLKKEMVPQYIQNVTLKDSSSGCSRTPTKTKTEIPAKMRKLIPATSSKSSLLGKESPSDRRKSNIISPTSDKQSEILAMNRSFSSLCTLTYNKSPNLLNKPAKNPKYAHVQSTIPKASGSKKKKIQ